MGLTREEEFGLPFERREHPHHGGGTPAGRLDDGGERLLDVALEADDVGVQPLAVTQLARVHLSNGNGGSTTRPISQPYTLFVVMVVTERTLGNKQVHKINMICMCCISNATFSIKHQS